MKLSRSLALLAVFIFVFFPLLSLATSHLPTTVDPDSRGNCPPEYTKITSTVNGQQRVQCVLTSTLDANCRSDQVWDPNQNRCVPRPGLPTYVDPDSRGNCPSQYTKITDTVNGQERVRCILTSTLDANCPGGGTWNPETNSCVGGDDGDPNAFNLKLVDPIGAESFPALLDKIINALMLLAGPVAVIMVIYAAFLYTTSGGNEDKIKTANRTLLYVAIGFGVLLLAKSATSIAKEILGVEDDGPFGIDELLEIGRAVANVLIAVVGLLSVIFIVLSGFQFVTSGGDEEKVRKARDYLMYAIIGLIVALLAFGVTAVVNDLIDQSDI